MSKKNAGIDLDAVDVSKSAEAGFEFEVEHPDSGEGIGVFITVRGEEAQSIRLSGIRAASESIIRDRMKGESKQKKSAEQQIAELEAELTETINEKTPEKAAQRVIAWRGVKRAGVDVPCNEANCIELFTKLPFIQVQVFEQSRKLGNFFAVPSQTSAPTRQKSSS
jgi:hypothetical protein